MQALWLPQKAAFSNTDTLNRFSREVERRAVPRMCSPRTFDIETAIDFSERLTVAARGALSKGGSKAKAREAAKIEGRA